MNTKKSMKRLMDLSNMGAVTMQSTSLFTTYKNNPAGAIPGMVGVGVASGVANASFNLARGSYKRKRRR